MFKIKPKAKTSSFGKEVTLKPAAATAVKSSAKIVDSIPI